MAYRIKRKETPREAVHRIADEQIGRALESLRDGADRAEAIHDARKRLKKLRAVARLVRDEVGDTRYREENRRFRDAGRALSAVRDAEVLVETLDELRTRFDSVLYARAFETGRRELLRRRDEAARALLEDAQRDEAVVAELEAAQARLGDWPIEDESWSAFSGGLQRVYGRGRRAMAKAYETGGAADFHDWRKRVKYLWYHLRLLRNLWPPVLSAGGDEVKRLADLLGKDHDLAVLDQTLRAEPDAFGAAPDLEALLGLIAGRSEALRAGARPLGRRLFAEKPGAFVERMEAYWLAWRSGSAEH